MTELLERAVEAARKLSPEMQDEIAHLLLQIAGDGEQPVACLSPEEAASFDESFAHAARGAFASDERVHAIWAKHGS